MNASRIVLKRLEMWDAGDHSALWKELQQELAVAQLARASKAAGRGSAAAPTLLGLVRLR